MAIHTVGEPGPTARQLGLIEELLDELGWTTEDISQNIGPEYTDYRTLNVRTAGELINYLITDWFSTTPD